MQFEGEPLVSKYTISNQVKETPHRVFWFKKFNGEIFCTQESEAWNILAGNVKVLENRRETSKRHEYLGASDSLTYFRGLKEAKTVCDTQGLEKAQEFLRSLVEKEIASADKTIRPRNFERTNAEGIPVGADGFPLKF